VIATLGGTAENCERRADGGGGRHPCYGADAYADPNAEESLIAMKRRPSARTVMPGVRVVTISSSCGAEEHCRKRLYTAPFMPNESGLA
jgi:hypothetical protein